MRVIVVGAGIAGLTCARVLQAAGVDVTVLEGGTRAGGRARTVRSPFAEGQYVESGAEWIDTDHHRMRALLDRYGLRLQGPGQEWTTIRRMLFRDGRLFDAAEVRELDPAVDDQLATYDAAFERIADGIADPARPDLHPDAALHDARTIADVARDCDLGDLAQLFARRNSQGEFAAEQHEVSALFVGQQRAQMRAHGIEGVVRAHRLEGGLDVLVARLAGELRDGTIRFGETVRGVHWESDEVRVDTGVATHHADRVVFACSLVPLRSVVFTPELPIPFARAVRELGYGTITKTAVQFGRRTWPSGYATTSLPAQRVYEPTVDQPGEHGVLMSYAGGDGGRRAAVNDERHRIDAVVDDLRTMYGLDEPVTGSFSRAWSNEPRYGGSYAAYGPGQVTAFWQVLREPCGPFRLAGEHVATWTGYLEGAVESGERVAHELVALA
ncbi:MAG: flavin monoamine oxidase family protein [Actinomycetes bacterium]